MFGLTVLFLINMFYIKGKISKGFSRVRGKNPCYLGADESYLGPNVSHGGNKALKTREGYEQKPTSNKDRRKAQDCLLNNEALSNKDEKKTISLSSASNRYPKYSTNSRVDIGTVRKNDVKNGSDVVSPKNDQSIIALQRYTHGRNKKIKRALTSTSKLNFLLMNLRFAALLKQNLFDVWVFRNRFRCYEDLGLHEDPSVKGLHVGNPNRLKNVILKAIQGKTIEVVVIGGSNSAGGGIDKDEKSLKGLYFNMFKDWWSKMFGDANEPRVNIQNLAIGGTGSALFTFCFKTFLDKPDEFDIVLMETAVNFDRRSKSPAEPAEQLVRVLLFSPSAPAVMFINLVSGLGKSPITNKTINPTCSNLEDYGLVEIAKHYKITTFSLRDVVCPKTRKKRHISVPNMASSDHHHIGIKAHAQIALMLINYTVNNLREVLHELQKRNIEENVQTVHVRFEIAKIPGTLLIKKTTAIVNSPLCWTAVTPNRFRKVHHPSFNLEASENRGFVLQDTLEKETKGLRTDAQSGWVAFLAGNLIRFNFDVPPWRRDSTVHSRSIIIVIRTSGYGGVGEVCIDNVKRKTNCKRIDSKSIYGQNRLHPVATRVHPGKHSLTVKIVRKGMFMVSGVLVGPPDFRSECL